MSKLTYKLFRVRKDGAIGSLFINAQARYTTDVWMEARPFRKKGFQFRPGWHSMCEPKAPHLSIKGRAWYLVEIDQYSIEQRPASQGGEWYLSDRLRIVRPLNEQELSQTVNYA